MIYTSRKLYQTAFKLVEAFMELYRSQISASKLYQSDQSDLPFLFAYSDS